MPTEQREFIKITKGTSRGRDTYGYAIVSLYEKQANNRYRRIASCNGGGYDMNDTVLGDYLATRFEERLKRLTGYWSGVTVSKNGETLAVDGGVGWNKMIQLAHAIGVEITEIGKHRQATVYVVTAHPMEEDEDE